MTTVKDNWWNRLFHRKMLRMQRIRHKLHKADFYIRQIQQCQELGELLVLHRQLWKDGFRKGNIRPNKYGMFRTADIAHMQAEEVYLGNIYGLWTFSIPDWERMKGKTFGLNAWGIPEDTTLGQIVAGQYRDILLSSMKAMRRELETIRYER